MAELVYAKKRLEPIITKFSIDVENDKVFHAIVTLFPGQTDYQMWALKAVFSKSTTLDNIINIKEWIDENPTEIQHLSKKNLVLYKNFGDFANLRVEIESINAISFIRNTISKFNTAQRHLFTDKILAPFASNPYEALKNSLVSTFYKLLKDFETLPTDRKQKFISLMSPITDLNVIKKHLENALTETYEWNREDMLSYAQRCCPDVEVTYDMNNIVVLRIPSFESSQKLCGNGRTSWCLTREKSYFNNYTTSNGNAQQYFLFDFNRKESHELAHVGFSVNPTKGINYAHTTRNNNLMGGQNIDGRTWDINSVLSFHNINKSVYVRLKQLKAYKWDKESFLNTLSKHHFAVNQIDDNRFIVPIDNSVLYDILLSHTLVGSNLCLNSNQKTFAVFDFSKELNDEKSILILIFTKDRYEILSFNTMYDAYCGKSTESSALGKNNLTSDMFIKVGEMNPDILLHKLIDEQNIVAAIKLLEENENVDPNTMFYGSIPVIKAITSRNANLFKALANHKKFDLSLTEGFGEPYLQFIMLYMETLVEDKKVNLKPFFEMAFTFIDNDKYNINNLDINGDSALHVACEMEELSPIVERLVANPKCDVNIKNEWGYTPLDVALDNAPVNMQAVNLLLSRQDLKISDETKKFASEQAHINLDELREKVLVKNEKKQEVNKQEVDEYSDIFAKAFGLR